MLSRVEHEKSFITSGPDPAVQAQTNLELCCHVEYRPYMYFLLPHNIVSLLLIATFVFTSAFATCCNILIPG